MNKPIANYIDKECPYSKRFCWINRARSGFYPEKSMKRWAWLAISDAMYRHDSGGIDRIQLQKDDCGYRHLNFSGT